MLLSALLYFAFLSPTLASSWGALPYPCEADTLRRAALHGASFTYNYDKAGTATSLSYDGKITFTDDERDIKSITPGGYFRFSKTTFGNKREIFIQSGSDGTLRRKYYAGKSEQPYEPEGRQWLQEMLPEIIATTGIGAEDRIRRIYAKGGLSGVLAKIGEIDSDYARSTYYSHLLALPNLKDQDFRGVLAHMNHNLESDHEKSKLLRQLAPRYLQNTRNTQEYISAVAGLDSDYEKAKVLTYVLQTPTLTQSNCELVLPAVARIDSDYEQAKVLRAVLAKPALSPKAHKEIIHLARAIDSDYEKNRVLLILISNPKYVTANFGELLASINTLDSDYEKSRALSYLAGKQKLNTHQYLQLLQVVSSLDSSYDKGRALQKIRATMPADNAEVRAAYLKAAKTMNSEYEYRKAIAGLE
jgi:DNA-directed RNA polymerase subunit F